MTCRIMFQLKPNKKAFKDVLTLFHSFHPKELTSNCVLQLSFTLAHTKPNPHRGLGVKDLVLVIFPLSWFWSPDFFHFKGKESLRLSDRCNSLVWLEGTSFMAYHSFSSEESRFYLPRVHNNEYCWDQKHSILWSWGSSDKSVVN